MSLGVEQRVFIEIHAIHSGVRFDSPWEVANLVALAFLKQPHEVDLPESTSDLDFMVISPHSHENLHLVLPSPPSTNWRAVSIPNFCPVRSLRALIDQRGVGVAQDPEPDPSPSVQGLPAFEVERLVAASTAQR